MKITVTTHDDHLFVLDVSEDLELINFKALCEVETGIPSQETGLTHNGQLLVDDFSTMKNLGVHDGDVIIIQRVASSATAMDHSFSSPSNNMLPQFDFSRIQVPGSSNSNTDTSRQHQMQDAEYVRNLFLSSPEQLALLKQNNPRLADTLTSNKIEEFANVMAEQMEERKKREDQRIRMMKAHPFDSEAQKLIAEEIRQKNIEANMEAAMEYNPEMFGTVVMLYINCKVDGYPVKAFIDSGAQTTIMSSACAERCNIMRLVDSRWAGLAKGVGVQKIIGRIHMVQVAIENDFLTTSFSVLEDQPMDMLLGLDMLKRHQCCIDLEHNVLKIGTTGTETPFLPENELPDCGRLTTSSDHDGTKNEDKELRKAIDESKKTQQSSDKRRRDAYFVQITHFPLLPGTSKSSQSFKETDITELINLGFSREQVIQELKRFNGNKNEAMASLFAKILKF
ncbi:protein DDI1 homolog 2 isoform X3 [Rhopalosiphum padi]|uniref:protein DDI1 homolog 2 isoform X3 n=1 Tax=Rhopalosiphum padi TaxID=40932 RepID=UPI00298E9507|nr:protein DDI1 homolog 2 isoform X3 [Rhopalosiphum padi]